MKLSFNSHFINTVEFDEVAKGEYIKKKVKTQRIFRREHRNKG